MVGLWQNPGTDFFWWIHTNCPASLKITAADADHILMDGVALKITRIRVSSFDHAIVIDTPPNGFRILNDVEMFYFPLAGGSLCQYRRNAAP